MIMTSMQLIFAAVMMLAQPARHDDDGGHISSGVAVAWSHDVAPEQALPRSATAAANREIAIRSERTTPAARTRVAKRAAPNSRQIPRVARLVAPNSSKMPRVAAVAAHVTSATTVMVPQQKAKNTDAEKTAPVSPNDTDHLVAVLMARPEIKSVSDLAGKSIAIDIRQSASNGSVRTAIAAAGAAEVQLSEGQTTAINRVANGEVPAAVLALVSPEAAEGFPEIAGFKIFRVPLSPRALKGRPNTP
jgi:hypothetical protein